MELIRKISSYLASCCYCFYENIDRGEQLLSPLLVPSNFNHLEVRTVFLGFHGSGKTTLINQLDNSDCSLDETVPTLKPLFRTIQLPPMEQYGYMEPIKLKCIDLSGHFKNIHLWDRYLNNENVDLIVYVVDVSDVLTLDDSVAQLQRVIELNSSLDQLPLLIVVNRFPLAELSTKKNRLLDKLGIRLNSSGNHTYHGKQLSFEVGVIMTSNTKRDISNIVHWILGVS